MNPATHNAAESAVIPLSNVTRQVAAMRPAIDRAIDGILRSGEFERGPVLDRFEASFAQFCGARFGIGVGCGYASLFLALKACNIGPGDEVITVANTDMATSSAIGHTGATPIWVDIDGGTYNMDPACIEAAITPRTRAIVPVHLYGLPADMDPILEIAAAHGLLVIEDAALAAGASYFGRPTGSIGHVAGFSFAPVKILGAIGDGGCITTNDPEIAARARLWGSYGETREHEQVGQVVIRKPLEHTVLGYHNHLDPLQAAVLQEKLNYVSGWIARRQAIARRYDEAFRALGLGVQQVPEGYTNVYRSYVIRAKNRDRIRRALAEQNVETAVIYAPPIHLQPVFRHRGLGPGSLPETEAMAAELIALPMFPELTDDEVAQVIAAMQIAVRA